MTATIEVAAPAGAATTGRARTGRTVFWVLVVVAALLLVGVMSSGSGKDKKPFDPTSTAPDGTKAMVELLEELGAEVEVATSFPPVDADVGVIFIDFVPVSRLDDVRAWVRDGHTLVITDPVSDLTPLADLQQFVIGEDLPPVTRATCDVTALRDVGPVAAGGRVATYRVQPEMGQCFSNGKEAFLVVVPEGQGQIVAIGSGEPFVNRSLDQHDSAVLVTTLLAPSPGTRVSLIGREAFPDARGPGDGEDVVGLDRIFTLGAGLLLLQLIVAGAVYGLHRGRRVGKPVLEPQPVQIAGSELVGAVGQLLQRAKNPDNAAAMLRADVRRDLCRRFGLAQGATPDIVADTIAERTGIDRDRALRALVDHPVADDRALVELANQIESIREEVLHGHAP